MFVRLCDVLIQDIRSMSRNVSTFFSPVSSKKFGALNALPQLIQYFLGDRPPCLFSMKHGPYQPYTKTEHSH